jgi:hypothetical protein
LAEFCFEKSTAGAKDSNLETKAGEYQQGWEQIQRRRRETHQVQKIKASIPENTYWKRVSGQL